MHDVSLLVDHDVAVVPVLDLQQEPDHAVRRHRSREGPPSPLESLVGSIGDRIGNFLDPTSKFLSSSIEFGLHTKR